MPNTPPPKPTILIIHGAWTPATALHPFAHLLETHGFHVVIPQLPSINANNIKATFADDVALIHSTLTTLADAGHPILVLMHSYGGIVGANAITPDLVLSTRQKQKPQSGGVIGLLYVAAMMVKKGQSSSDSTAGFKSPSSDLKDGFLLVQNAPYYFFNDLHFERAEQLSAGLIPWSLAGASESMAELEPWRYLPTTFLTCELDLAMALGAQERMVKYVKGEMAERLFVEERIRAGHFPFFSVPEEVLRVVRKSWRRFLDVPV